VSFDDEHTQAGKRRPRGLRGGSVVLRLKIECAALAGLALYTKSAAHQLCQTRGDGQAQSDTPENGARSDVLTKNYPYFVEQTFSNWPGNPTPYVLDAGAPRPTRVELPATGGAIVATAIPGAANQSYYAISPDFRTGYAHVASVSLQHELRSGFTLETGYTRALSDDLPYAIGNLNRSNAISKALGAVEAQVSEGSGQYNALQSKIEKRFSRFLGMLVSYTYAKSMDNGPAPFNLGRNHQQPQNPLALDEEHALSSTDLRHNVVASFMAALPIAGRAQGWRRAARRMASERNYVVSHRTAGQRGAQRIRTRLRWSTPQCAARSQPIFQRTKVAALLRYRRLLRQGAELEHDR
jgi:hypothetical protein